jgi:uridine kinase
METNQLIIQDICIKRFKKIIENLEELLKSNTDPILVGIDGMCASGKTTLGYYLHEKFDCNLFHMDDFFLMPHQKTKERLAEVGGNVDYERFKNEVIDSILHKQNVEYRPYNCKTEKIENSKEIIYKRLNIIEGSYSLHPYFGDIYNIQVFISIPDNIQIERIKARNGNKMMSKFIKEWIPKENAYFLKYNIKKACTIINN